MLRLLRSYFFWTYERGTLHYDVMVTLILAFLFITPHFIDYHDRPVYRLPSQVMVQTDESGELVYQVSAADLDPHQPNTEVALRKIIEPIAGDVHIQNYKAINGITGTPQAYKVWAHR